MRGSSFETPVSGVPHLREDRAAWPLKQRQIFVKIKFCTIDWPLDATCIPQLWNRAKPSLLRTSDRALSRIQLKSGKGDKATQAAEALARVDSLNENR